MRRIAVVHTLAPGHPEWRARLNQAIHAIKKKAVDIIIVAGGRHFENGKEIYNNPKAMRAYLMQYGVPVEKIRWRDVEDEDIESPMNPTDTGDEVSIALSIIKECGWEGKIICPVSNWLHLVRIKAIYERRAKRSRIKLNLQPLPIPNLLGWKWAIMEIVLFWPYTLIDPGWEGSLAEKMRASRRQGGTFGAAGSKK